jgi:hypothetical protein
MLAVHRGLPLFEGGDAVNEMAFLRSKSAQVKRRHKLDRNLRNQLRDVNGFIATQTQVQVTGLQRRFDFQGKQLNSRERELSESNRNTQREVDKCRETEQELSDKIEDLRLANLDVARLNREKRKEVPQTTPVVTTSGAGPLLGRYQRDNLQQMPSTGFLAQYDRRDPGQAPLSTFDELRDAAFRPRLIYHRQSRPPGSERQNDMQLQMFQAFKEVCSAASGSGRLNTLSEKYPDGATCDEYYESLTKPWNTWIPDYGKIKELYKVAAHVAKFTGDRLSYSAWKRKFFAMVHNQRMLVADKALALSAALDTTNQDLAAILQGTKV